MDDVMIGKIGMGAVTRPVHCLICNTYLFGASPHGEKPVMVCEKCRKAVMKVRDEMRTE